MLPPVAGRDDDDTRRINWYWIAAWTGIGVALLCLAGALEGLWEWTGVSNGIMVHVGATLLLAPLLPFLEKSLTRRVVQENKRMVQQETAGLREQVDSLATRIDQLQALVDEQDASNVRDQDRIIDALSEEVSFMNVASAMTVANMVGALPGGEITLHASTDPMIDLAFSWQHRVGDGRFSEPSGTFLGVKAHVTADPYGGGTPVIQTIWKPTENAETVIGRITDQLKGNGTAGTARRRSTGSRYSGTCTGPSCSPSPTSAATPPRHGSCTAACTSFTARTGPSLRLGSSNVRPARSCWTKATSRSRPRALA